MPSFAHVQKKCLGIVHSHLVGTGASKYSLGFGGIDVSPEPEQGQVTPQDSPQHVLGVLLSTSPTGSCYHDSLGPSTSPALLPLHACPLRYCLYSPMKKCCPAEWPGIIPCTTACPSRKLQLPGPQRPVQKAGAPLQTQKHPYWGAQQLGSPHSQHQCSE